VQLEGNAPYPASNLIDLIEVDFEIPCGDPWLAAPATPAHSYLNGAKEGWDQHPEWMDFLDECSPAHDLKDLERGIYEHWWRPWLGVESVMDIGCGIGRMTMPLLDRGLTVWGIDGDLNSLRRCAWHAAGRAGKLDLFWTSVHHLPDVGEVDVIIACEVYCYVPAIHKALTQATQRLRRGGALLISVEARWGWAASEDAPIDGIEEALAGSGILNRPGDRWVKTYTREELRQLLEGAGLRVEKIVGTHYLTDGPLERSLPESVELPYLLELEERCREHPVWAPLNRAWTAVAIRDD
jgi:2-polyprenyl-3-methyl-5-hydroxy-6-metoxy-1,4-benzoquinol methylase